MPCVAFELISIPSHQKFTALRSSRIPPLIIVQPSTGEKYSPDFFIIIIMAVVIAAAAAAVATCRHQKVLNVSSQEIAEI